jgi:hypothetical protein
VLKLVHYLLFAFSARGMQIAPFALDQTILFYNSVSFTFLLWVGVFCTTSLLPQQTAPFFACIRATNSCDFDAFFALCFAFLCEDSAVAKKTKQNKTARRLTVAFC